MVRLLLRTLILFAANAVGLLAAAFFLEDFTVNYSAFLLAVIVFTLSEVILGPLVIKIALKNASFLMGGISLVTTFVGLVITAVVTTGLKINGINAWAMSTLIIWLFSMIANVMLPLFVFKKAVTTTAPTEKPSAD